MSGNWFVRVQSSFPNHAVKETLKRKTISNCRFLRAKPYIDMLVDLWLSVHFLLEVLLPSDWLTGLLGLTSCQPVCNTYRPKYKDLDVLTNTPLEFHETVGSQAEILGVVGLILKWLFFLSFLFGPKRNLMTISDPGNTVTKFQGCGNSRMWLLLPWALTAPFAFLD